MGFICSDTITKFLSELLNKLIREHKKINIKSLQNSGIERVKILLVDFNFGELISLLINFYFICAFKN